MRQFRVRPRKVLLAAGGGIFLLLLALLLSQPNATEVTATHDLPCYDVDGDWKVTGLDIYIVSFWFGSTIPPAPAAADVDGDTDIDFVDLFDTAGAYDTYDAFPFCQDVPAPMPGVPAKGSVVTNGDIDADNCDDVEENGLVPALGGERDYLNPWDFYDIDGDGVITLFGDIFPVALAFGLTPPDPGYSPGLDRSGPIGPDPWDMGPPDGVIDLFTDIFGVAYQFGHDCSAPP